MGYQQIEKIIKLYATYEDVFGLKLEKEELINRIRNINKVDILQVLSYLVD